jgi:hypothetical protein
MKPCEDIDGSGRNSGNPRFSRSVGGIGASAAAVGEWRLVSSPCRSSKAASFLLRGTAPLESSEWGAVLQVLLRPVELSAVH